MPHNKKNNTRKYLIAGLGAVIVIAVLFFAFSSLSPQSTVPTTTTGTVHSTLTTFSYQDGEDVSNQVEVDIWVPKSSSEFDEVEDIYTLSNFELLGSTQDAEDVDDDFSDYEYIWIEIDPDGTSVFANDFHLIYGGMNRDYTLYVYHQTSDVNFNLFEMATLNEITVSGYATDSNVSLIFDCPHYTTSNIHANTVDWACDDDDWEDMSDNEKADYYDEKYWRCQAPTYDPSIDVNKEAKDDLEKITNAFAFKITCNDTISTEDGNANQVNITIDADEPVEIVVSGTDIYLIYYDVVSFESGAQRLDIELEFGTDITLSDIDSGRIVVPDDDDNLGTFTKYSDIAA